MRFRGGMCVQQVSPGQSGEVSLVCGYDPISSASQQHPGHLFWKTGCLFHEERVCSLQSAETCGLST